MPLRGLHTSARSSLKPVNWVMLFGILFLTFMYLRKKIFSPDSGNGIYTVLRSNGFSDELSKWITAQSAFETANFSSNIFKSNNNAFGMKYAGQTIALGEKNGYANYKSVTDSIADLINWYNRHRHRLLSFPLVINSLSDYVKFLKNEHYFEAAESSYLAGVAYYHKLFYNG